jgi:formylglycine-generating enzyme required for sulfatase activity
MKNVLVLMTMLATPGVCQAVVVVETVPIGNPSNPGDVQLGQGIFGAVTYNFSIAKTEVTNAQYVEFLNAKAATDTHGLYNTFMGGASTQGGITRSGSSGSYTYAVKASVAGQGPNGGPYTYGDKPVVYVSWNDAARFANWMHNGQGTGDTETGTYDMSAGTITRAAGQPWFLPDEDEWYKAAYYDGANALYRDYPTNSDTPPNHNKPANDTGNSANFFADGVPTTENSSYPHTPTGAYTMSDSAYGTFDQGGSVWEWNETIVTTSPTRRGLRGGGWDSTVDTLVASYRSSAVPGTENHHVGFRLATLPPGVPGDYNGNGTVDAADYVMWRKGGPLLNEVNAPGTVNAQDYTEWRMRFGNNTPSGSGAGGGLGATSVPEPGAWLLVVGAFFFASCATARGVCRARLVRCGTACLPTPAIS